MHATSWDRNKGKQSRQEHKRMPGNGRQVPLHLYWWEKLQGGSAAFKFLGATLGADLKWALHSAADIRKVQQCLFFLRHLRKVQVSAAILYRCLGVHPQGLHSILVQKMFSTGAQSTTECRASTKLHQHMFSTPTTHAASKQQITS